MSAADAFQAIGAVAVPPSTASVNVPPLALPAVTSQVPVVADSVEPLSSDGPELGEPRCRRTRRSLGAGVKVMLHGPVPVAVAVTPTRSRAASMSRAAVAFQAIGAVAVPPSTASVNVPPLALPAVTSQVPVVAGRGRAAVGDGREPG